MLTHQLAAQGHTTAPAWQHTHTVARAAACQVPPFSSCSPLTWLSSIRPCCAERLLHACSNANPIALATHQTATQHRNTPTMQRSQQAGSAHKVGRRGRCRHRTAFGSTGGIMSTLDRQAGRGFAMCAHLEEGGWRQSFPVHPWQWQCCSPACSVSCSGAANLKHKQNVAALSARACLCGTQLVQRSTPWQETGCVHVHRSVSQVTCSSPVRSPAD